MKIDLHIHSDISDGSLNTLEVIKLAKENNVEIISITNHDTTKGLKEAIKIGKEYEVKVISGIEISAYDYKRNRKVHLLGYNIDLESKNINKICEELLKDRHELSVKQLGIIKELGYDISIENIKNYSKNSEVIYKQHIMKELINKGYTDKMYSSLYDKLFRKNGPCYMSINYIDIYDAIDAIIKDNGIPVLAHSGQLSSYELLEELVPRGLKGIEKYHLSHSKSDLEKIDELAKKHNLFITGGSDFHGEYGKENTIGSYTTPIESLSFLSNK